MWINSNLFSLPSAEHGNTNFDTHTHTQMVKHTLKTTEDETSQQTTTSHLLEKQTFNYSSYAALLAERRVLMCATK